MPLALIVAKHDGKTLFIFNTWRDVWELPGGIIDEDETPHDAAIRELEEESGQKVENAEYVGWAKFRLKPDDHLELGVLYRCEIEQPQPFTPNEEASEIMWWDVQSGLASPVEGHVNEIDLYLAKLCP